MKTHMVHSYVTVQQHERVRQTIVHVQPTPYFRQHEPQLWRECGESVASRCSSVDPRRDDALDPSRIFKPIDQPADGGCDWSTHPDEKCMRQRRKRRIGSRTYCTSLYKQTGGARVAQQPPLMSTVHSTRRLPDPSRVSRSPSFLCLHLTRRLSHPSQSPDRTCVS